MSKWQKVYTSELLHQAEIVKSRLNESKLKSVLLNKKEISGLIGKYKEQGMTVVPLELYTKRGLVKLKIGIGRGKKKYDKREVIRKREDERKIRRVLRARK